jgi:hypothetical protein
MKELGGRQRCTLACSTSQPRSITMPRSLLPFVAGPLPRRAFLFTAIGKDFFDERADHFLRDGGRRNGGRS